MATLLGTSGGLVAGPIGIPDSARPGALRPEEIDRDRLPREAADPVMDVPAMIDRPLGVEEGPRVEVTRFELVGANDWPQYDVAVADIEAILEEQRLSRPEGFTIGLLDEMTAEITNYYRERGLILAQAVIPVQTVEDDGVVKVEVIEGKLGRVLAEGNAMYSEAVMTKPFKHLIGKPVTKDEMESALLTLTDFPGLTVFGVFQPGQKVGESDVVLKVQKEDRFDFALRVDNHGTPETGLNRGRLTIDWNNITGGADRLTLTTQRSINPTNSKFASADYERYLGRG
ncbi:MAG: ShlB/FhaC/HecB family hemolysin secretion/activation protein, partial [Gammaproteobacteria bacterium]